MDIDGLEVIQKIYAVLKAASGQRMPLTYSEAMLTALGWDYKNAYQRNVFAYMLKGIANIELGAGHPPLTALVVSKDTKRPNEAFFDWARSEGRFRKDETDQDYWEREIERVYARWLPETKPV
jgi:hypothetical protein